MKFRSLKRPYVGKTVLAANQFGSAAETLLFSLQICGFPICGLEHQGNLRICDLRINNYKFADLRFAGWNTQEFADFDCGMSPRISGLEICGLTK